MVENIPKKDRRMSLAASSLSSHNSKDNQRRMSSVSFMSPSPLFDSAEGTPSPRTVNTLQLFLRKS